MALDLNKTAAQLLPLTGRLRERAAGHATARDVAVEALQRADPGRIEQRRRAGKATFLVAAIDDALADAVALEPLPADYTVLAVDGSHIDVDRHAPARCYVLNIGNVLLRYGELASARLWNAPVVYADEDVLTLRDATELHEERIEGPLLGVVRAVEEVRALAGLVEALPDDDTPALALLDGSLILWGLSGQAFPDFVREELLGRRLLPALDRLHAQAARRRLGVASYVSLPRSTDVVNALRLHSCPYPVVNCDQRCRGLRAGTRPCDGVHGVTDAAVFAEMLAPGERSAVFHSTSSVVTGGYGPHQVAFFYVNAGVEIARVETPSWVAADAGALSFVQAAIVAQAAKGQGYPVALQEAHEQAVVTGADHDAFARLMERVLGDAHLPYRTSEKARSKRTRAV